MHRHGLNLLLITATLIALFGATGVVGGQPAPQAPAVLQTVTSTPTPTGIPTATLTATPISSPTATPALSPTATATPTTSSTETPPPATPTIPPSTATPAPATQTPIPTSTALPTPTPTASPQPQGDAVLRYLGQVNVRSLGPPGPPGLARARPLLTPLGPGKPPVAPPHLVPPANASDKALQRSAAPDAQPLAPPAAASSFAGLGSSDNLVQLHPPDPQLATGPNHVFELVNITGRIFNKTGTDLSSFSLATFFGVPSGWADFDPKVIYDALSGRFFGAYVSLTDNGGMSFCGAPDCGRLHIAVSQTNDPSGTWNVYYLELTNDFPDYPGIGLTDDKLTISYNRFDIDAPDAIAYKGAQTFVFKKSDLLAGSSTPAFASTSPNGGLFTVRPAHSLNGTTTQYMASVDPGSATSVHLFTVTGEPGVSTVTISEVAAPTISNLATPPDAQQQGTTALISTNDNRILEAVWRNNRLWLAANSACTPSGDSEPRSCLKLVEIDTGSNTVVQDIVFGTVGEHLYYPAIRTDGNANLHVVFTRSSITAYAEARVAGRRSSDAPNTMNGSTLLKVGEIAYDPPGFASQRWGDYSGAAVDPSDPTQVWVVGEYAKNDGAVGWGTYIGRLQYAPEISITTDGSVAFGTVGLSMTINTTPTGINDVQRVSVASGPADLFIKTTAFSDGLGNTWTLGATNGANQVKWEFSKDGNTWTPFTVAGTLFTLDTNVPTGATRNVYLQLVMPTSTGSVNQHSVTVTIVAVAP